MACTSSKYRECFIHVELLHEDCWLAYVLESVVCGMGDTPTAAIAHMTQVMEKLPNYGIDMVRTVHE
jgi:hypothetical protein